MDQISDRLPSVNHFTWLLRAQSYELGLHRSDAASSPMRLQSVAHLLLLAFKNVDNRCCYISWLNVFLSSINLCCKIILVIYATKSVCVGILLI